MAKRKDAASASAEMEALCGKFEEAWNSNKHPIIDRFVAQGLTGWEPTARRELLIELVVIDLERRWRAAQKGSRRTTAAEDASSQAGDALPSRPLLEDYLKEFPELGAASNLPDDVIAHEYFGIDTDILWDVIEHRIPALLVQLQKVLEEMS